MRYNKFKKVGVFMFKMAYAIQCHKNVNQVNRLIENLDNPNIDFFIHVDKKSDIINEILKKENVHILKSRIDVQWGGFSQVEATLHLFKRINKSGPYSYIHLISGQDFPVKSKNHIQKFFQENNGKQFIEFIDLPQILLNRVKVYYPRFFSENGKFGIMRGVYKRLVMNTKWFTRDISRLPTLYKGSSWFSITGDCLEYILKFIDDNEFFYTFFKNTFCGDEVFFQTILVNSPYKMQIVNDNQRYILWKEGDKSPKTLVVDDYNDIINSEKLFARKFDATKDDDILKIIEEQIKEI